jgi:uncharacterized protein (TIGR02145 family)
MNIENRFWFQLLIVTGVALFLTISCNKVENNPLSMTDPDGNVYTSVTIGKQVWMAENLKTSKYRNGDLIGTTIPATLHITGENSPGYQWAYDGDEANVPAYGRLYTWWAVTDRRKICPAGWHVPSDAEWTTLTTFLGGDSVAGGKLREAGTTHWATPNNGATNETGFTALPGGYKYTGPFYGKGSEGDWWSSTETEPSYACSRLLSSNNDRNIVRIPNDWEGYGFSVRCLRDN